jgi:hypothetical protein
MAYLCAKCYALVCTVNVCAEYGVCVFRIWCVRVQNMAYLCAEYDLFVCRIWLICVQNMGYLCAEFGVFVCRIWCVCVLTSPRVAECKLGAPSFAFDQLPGIDVLPLAAHPTHLSNRGEGRNRELTKKENLQY